MPYLDTNITYMNPFTAFNNLVLIGWLYVFSIGRAVFVRSNAGIVGSNPNQGMDVCVCVYSVCRQRPCDGLIPRPRSSTDSVQIIKTEKAAKV
jgi:hypothetical protein